VVLRSSNASKTEVARPFAGMGSWMATGCRVSLANGDISLALHETACHARGTSSSSASIGAPRTGADRSRWKSSRAVGFFPVTECGNGVINAITCGLRTSLEPFSSCPRLALLWTLLSLTPGIGYKQSGRRQRLRPEAALHAYTYMFGSADQARRVRSFGRQEHAHASFPTAHARPLQSFNRPDFVGLADCLSRLGP